MTYFCTKTESTRLRIARIARRQNDIETYTSMTYFCTKTESTRLRMTRIARRQNDIETYTSMTYFCTKTESTRLRIARITRRQNDTETYTSMTYFCTKTKATRLRMTRIARIIIANIIREIRVIRSSNHKVQTSNFKGESFSMSFYLFFIWIYCFFRNLCLTLQTDLIISILIYLIFG